MTLLIDLGNTRLKASYIDVHSSHQQPTKYQIALAHAELPQLLIWLKQHHLAPKKALGICVASTAVAQALEQLLSEIACTVQWLDATANCPLLLNHYDEPAQLGADRWLALIGILARQELHSLRPIIHASFGTATTIDTILPTETTANACFIGGLILPGPQMMYDALAQNTAQLGNGTGLLQDFPSNTRAAISSGIAAAQSGALLRQWQLCLQLDLGTPLLVCSGGGWDLIQEEIKNAYQQRLQLLNLAAETITEQPTPVLDGLSYMATHRLLPANPK